MKHMEHLEEIAALNAINPDTTTWSGWGSPVGLIIFFNGMALCAILIRYAILMK